MSEDLDIEQLRANRAARLAPTPEPEPLDDAEPEPLDDLSADDLAALDDEDPAEPEADLSQSATNGPESAQEPPAAPEPVQEPPAAVAEPEPPVSVAELRRQQERDLTINEALRRGAITPVQGRDWRAAFDANPSAATSLAAGLAAIPNDAALSVTELGHSDERGDPDADLLYRSIFGS